MPTESNWAQNYIFGHVCVCVCVCVRACVLCGTFNDDLTVSDHGASSGLMISEYRIEKKLRLSKNRSTAQSLTWNTWGMQIHSKDSRCAGEARTMVVLSTILEPYR
jgi:hypothetical protein